MKFAQKGAETNICSDKPTAECGGPMKEILKKLYTGCMANTDPKPTTPEPLTCGTDKEYKA